MKQDIITLTNSLKENCADLEKYRQIMADDEKNRRFTHDQDVVAPTHTTLSTKHFRTYAKE